MVVVVVMVGWLARCSQYTAAAAAGVVFAWSIAQSQLFDWFAANDNSPAFAIALRCVPVCLCLCLCLCLCVCVCIGELKATCAFARCRCTRSCDPGIICCQSGGFIASGQVRIHKHTHSHTHSHSLTYTHSHTLSHRITGE